MPMISVDPLNDPSVWKALAADGATPSTQIAIAAEPSLTAPDDSAAVPLAVTASVNALNHVLRRTLTPIDLSQFDDLRFWISASRLANGAPANPFYLELRLASAAMGLDDPGNSWRRYLPVFQTQQWAPARLTLADLPAAVRGAVATLQLRCSDASAAFSCGLYGLIAARDAMIGDVDQALQARLDGLLKLGGVTIPAVLHPPGGAVAINPPFIQILHLDAIYCRARSDSAPARGDFSDQGYWLRPPGPAYELYYQVTASAADRATQAAMMEFILSALPARGQLLVNGQPLPMEAVAIAPINRLGGSRNDQLPLFYKISTRQPGQGQGVRAALAKNVSVNADYQSP
jgi:hypothetical protein